MVFIVLEAEETRAASVESPSSRIHDWKPLRLAEQVLAKDALVGGIDPANYATTLLNSDLKVEKTV